MPSIRCCGHVRMRLKVHTALLPPNEANLPRTSRPVNRSHNPAVNRDRWRRYGAFAASIAEHARHGASYNPLSERTIQNPYPVYARLRRHSPVHRSVILGSWILSRYDDVLAVARDHERFSNDPRWRNTTASVLPPAPDDYSILLVDPPEHTRLRKVAARAFTRPRLMTLEPTIEALEPRSGRAVPPERPLDGDDAALLAALKALRLELARERGVPAYIVFPDRTLSDMARRRPRSEAEFAEVNGVGAVKLEAFAQPFLAAIDAVLSKGDAAGAPQADGS